METQSETTKRSVAGAKAAVAAALEEHRRAGRSVVVEREGKIVVLTSDQIPVRWGYAKGIAREPVTSERGVKRDRA